MSVTLKPYVEVLANSKEEKEADLAGPRANETKAQLDLEIAKKDSALYQAEASIKTIAQSYPLNISGLMNALDQLQLQERSKKQLQDIVKQMFPK